MKTLINRKTVETFLSRHRMFFIIAAVNALLWSWLPFVEVTQLVEPPFLGRVIAVLVYFLIVALCTFLFGVVYRRLANFYRNQNNPLVFLAVLFCVWAAAELIVAWFVTIIWFGRGGSLDNVLPFASFTPLIMYTPFGLLSRLVGFHGVSALLMTLIVCLALKKLRRLFLPFALTVLMLWTFAWWTYRDANGTTLKATIVSEHLNEQALLAPTSADLVVLPEYGLDSISSDTVSSRIVSKDSEKEVFFVGSKQLSTDRGLENLLIFGTSRQGFVSETAKARLIPGGEYLPFALELPLRALRAEKTLQTFDFTRRVSRGDAAARPHRFTDNLIVGAEACASIISPNDYRTLTKQGATVLANAASLSIFRSPVFDMQHEGLARFMAVANARPLLQSVNTGKALAIDHNGRVLAETMPVDSQTTKIIGNNKTTPYTMLGEWPAVIGLVLIVANILTNYRHKARRTKAD